MENERAGTYSGKQGAKIRETKIKNTKDLQRPGK